MLQTLRHKPGLVASLCSFKKRFLRNALDFKLSIPERLLILTMRVCNRASSHEAFNFKISYALYI